MSKKTMKKAISQPEQKKAVVQPTKKSVEINRRVAELNKLRITTGTVIPPVQAVISVDDVPIFEVGDIGAVKAKPKAGKTTMLKAMVAALLKGAQFRLKSELKDPKVLWIDTEQKQEDVKQIITDVKQLTGMDNRYIDSHLKLYSVRTCSYKTMLEDTELLISTYRPNVVIVDGLVDYIESFNDEAQSHLLINALIKMSDDYKCAIINVLHENKSSEDHNMRGHLGTILSQKAGTVLQCKKDGNDVITVSCSDSRHRAMPDWKIRYDEYGNIIDAEGNQLTPAQQEKKKRIGIIKSIIQDNGGEITRKDLNTKLEEALGLNRTTVANLISEQLKSTLCEVGDMIKIQPELDLFS